MCNCWSKHHLLYMLAGASFWVAIVHTWLYASGSLPLVVGGYTITSQTNIFAIGIAVLLGSVLLYIASRSDSHSNCSSC